MKERIKILQNDVEIICNGSTEMDKHLLEPSRDIQQGMTLRK